MKNLIVLAIAISMFGCDALSTMGHDAMRLSVGRDMTRQMNKAMNGDVTVTCKVVSSKKTSENEYLGEVECLDLITNDGIRSKFKAVAYEDGYLWRQYGELEDVYN